MEKNVVYHILLWLFIFGIILDSMLFDYEMKEAILYSFIECSINAFIAYTNLLFFIPRFFERKGSLVYGMSIAVFFLLLLIPYAITDLGYYLLDTEPHRVILSFTINFMLEVMSHFENYSNSAIIFRLPDIIY